MKASLLFQLFLVSLFLVVSSQLPALTFQVAPDPNKPGSQDPMQQQIQQQADVDRRSRQMEQVQQDGAQPRPGDWARQSAQEELRRYYRELAADRDTLAKLAADLQSAAGQGQAAANSTETTAKLAEMEKVARNIRAELEGKNLRPLKPAKQSTVSAAEAEAAPQTDFAQRIPECVTQAKTLKQAMDQYLAKQNEHTVSADALKRDARKESDPLLDSMKSSAERLERIAFELRTHTQPEPVKRRNGS